MPKSAGLTGQRFGKLVVMERTALKEDGYVVWRCRCDCGCERLVNTKKLRRGTVSDCGCVPKRTAKNGNAAEDLTGRKFGELTVLSREENEKGRTMWLCQCSCGQKKIVPARRLKAGQARCCGAVVHQTDRNVPDIAGQRFGRLTALYPTKNRSRNSSVCWYCRCDCGNEIEVARDQLVYGNCKSCGCLKKEVQENIPDRLHRIDGTCVEYLEKRKHRNDNTSGFRGVFLMKDGRYKVSIGFKGKRYYVGIYKSFEDAVSARIEAENTIHGGFVDAYYIWKKKAEEHPEWGRENPLVFEAEKVDGKFRVTTNVDEEYRKTT